MENNEIMNYEETDVMNDDVVVNEGTGIGTGVAVLIGAGLTLAVGAAVKFGKKAVAAYKAKKELHKPDKEVFVEDEQIEEIVAKEDSKK